MKTKNTIFLSIIFSLSLLSSASPIYKVNDKFYLPKDEEALQEKTLEKSRNLHNLLKSASSKSEIIEILKNMNDINCIYYDVIYGDDPKYKSEKGDSEVLNIWSFLEDVLEEIDENGHYLNNKNLDYYLIKSLVDLGADVSLKTVMSSYSLKTTYDYSNIYELIKKSYFSKQSTINNLNAEDIEVLVNFIDTIEIEYLKPDSLLYSIEKFMESNPKFLKVNIEFYYPTEGQKIVFSIKNTLQEFFEYKYPDYLERFNQIFNK